MTHLRIEQGGITEYVTSTLIHKLYEYAKEIKDYEEDPLNNVTTSLVSLKGNLSVPACYRAEKTWLETKFPDLHITTSDYAIPFEDPNMLTYLNSIGVGSNGMITEALAAAATSIYSSTANTTVTKFNEFKFFTNITSPSSGGWNGLGTRYYGFKGWTALEEVDISNITAIGHGHIYNKDSTFKGCTSLKTVTASSSLEKIGASAFNECGNLETISGLSGEIMLASSSFEGCTKLSSDSFANVQFLLGTNDNESNDFTGCKALTLVQISTNTTKIPVRCFFNCSNLSLVNQSSCTTIDKEAFSGCTSLTSIDLSSCTSIGLNVFKNCTSLTSVDLSSCTTIGSQAFYGCSALLNVVGLSNVTSLGENAFRECSRLLSLIDLSNCNNIGKQAFQDCSSLTSVLLSTNLTTIPLGCFLRCSNLTNIDLSNVEIINGDWLYGAFLDCTGLTSIDLSSCTSIGNSCFMRCTSLQVSNTQNVTSIGNACFYGCSSITELYMPNVSLTGPTSNNKNNFGNCTLLSKITLGDCVTLGDDFSSSSEWNIYFLNCTSLHTVDVKSLQTVPNNIGDAVFKNCPNMRNFIIRSTTVPTVQNNGSTLIKHFGGSSVKIYVPDAAVNDYKNATGWSNVSDYIYPLSDYQP